MTEMSLQQFVQSILDRLQSTASIKTVYGDPIEARGKTIIPVAKVVYGFGAGSGKGKKIESQEDEHAGTGIGGGIAVKPAGVLEITQEGTRFIPISQTGKIVGVLLVGLLLGVILAGRRSRRKD